MKTKKILLILALLCAIVQGAWADKWDGWTKTEPPGISYDNGYKYIAINSAAELAYIAEHWDDEVPACTDLDYYEFNYILNADLDMTAATWAPMGGKAYKGTFNGNGHTISIKINNSSISSNYQGLFNTIHSEGTVKNLHVDCYIKVGNATNVAGICGENEGTIENCWVSGHIESSHYSGYDADLGGIAGLNDNSGKIKYCCVTADIKNTGGNSGVGGIAGSNEGNIQHVTFTGSVDDNGHGQNNKWVGDQDGTLENTYDSFSQSEYDADSSKDIYRRSIKYSSFNLFVISNSTDWDTFLDYVNHCCSFSGKSVRLDGNISTSSIVSDSEMNAFQGTFDGNGHTINISINDNNEGSALFRHINGATIKSLRITGSLNGGRYAAALVGIVNGTGNSIENCVLSLDVYGDNNVGGLVGHARSSGLTVNGCVFKGYLGMTGALQSGTYSTGVFIGGGDNGNNISVSNCLYIPSDGIYSNIQLVWAGSTTNNYVVSSSSSIATKAVAALPVGIGTQLRDYGMVRAYEHGIWYDNQYYVDRDLALSGFGTSGDPVRIGSTADWDKLVTAVNGGYTFSSMFVKQTANISVSNMVGVDDAKSFQGTYDGDGKKLTFNKGTAQSPFNENFCAPFRHVKNATIKKLHVDGTIYTSAQFAAGIVGESHGALTLTGCRSSVNINSSVDVDGNHDGTHGGLVSTLSGKDNTILIDGCVFDGSFTTTNGTLGCGGFVGWGVYNKPTIKNSLMKPSSVPNDMLGRTFARWWSGDGGIYEPTITNCYYVAVDNLPIDQGTKAIAFASTDVSPISIGMMEQDYGMVKAYKHALFFDGKYFAPETCASTGDDEYPYTISNNEQWETFAALVNNGTNNFNGKFVKLTADITVQQMLGTGDHKFSGTFLGDGVHTLTFNRGTDASAFNEEYCAPFRYVNNATIRDLKVKGDIYTSKKFAAGLVAQPSGTTNITNCLIGTVIHSNIDGDGTHGGIVARLGSNTTTMNITGCVFNGRLLTNNGTHSCSGFIGWWDNKTANISNSLYAPDANITPGAGETAITDGATFIRDNYTTLDKCFFTEALSVAQGTKAYAFATAPAYLGSVVQNYDMMTVYDNGILFDGTYYVAPVSISLANAADNSTTIINADGYVADVALAGRTLYKDGAWNTLCLPFNVTISGSPLAGATARPLTSASISGTTLNLTFGDPVSTLTAGTPYIIKWTEGENLTEANLVFNGVTIDKSDHSFNNNVSGDARVRFIGTYKSTEFDATDNSVLLLGGNNKLYYPGKGAGLGAQRAYFKLGSGEALARQLTSFNIDFGDESTGIVSISKESGSQVASSGWYTLDGRRLDGKPSRAGVYINNGNKVVIK